MTFCIKTLKKKKVVIYLNGGSSKVGRCSGGWSIVVRMFWWFFLSRILLFFGLRFFFLLFYSSLATLSPLYLVVRSELVSNPEKISFPSVLYLNFNDFSMVFLSFYFLFSLSFLSLLTHFYSLNKMFKVPTTFILLPPTFSLCGFIHRQ